MRIAVLSYIGHEDDIVEAFVEHTMRFADFLTVVSTAKGATRQMLLDAAANDSRIRVITHDPAYHDQHEVLSALLVETAAVSDWILPLDADEFVSGDIRRALEESDISAAHALRWKTYVPTSKDNPEEANVLQRMHHRREPEEPAFTKIVIPARIVTADTRITQGNHACIDQQGVRTEGEILDGVFLAHFPVRSSLQMQSKIDRSWPAVDRNPAKLTNEALHWKALHNRFAGRAIDTNTLTEIALRYASPIDAPLPSLMEDPVHTDGMHRTS